VGRANGGMVVHLGVVVVAVAFAASSSYVSQGEFRLAPGDTATVSGHTVRFEGLETEELDERTVTRALVQVDDDGVYAPSLSQFRFGGQTIGSPSVRVSPVDDVYLALQALPTDGGEEVLLRVIVQPLIMWLWVGGGIMAVGTVLAAFPGRRRRPTDPVSSLVSDPISDPASTETETETEIPVLGAKSTVGD
jgi:cytochrome c-type biogenesis protein CcmF